MRDIILIVDLNQRSLIEPMINSCVRVEKNLANTG